MRLDKVSQYDLVVVNDLPDTIVYQVDRLNGFIADLSYESGYKRVGGGSLDVSCLKKPTKKQLKNSGLL